MQAYPVSMAKYYTIQTFHLSVSMDNNTPEMYSH